MDNKIESLLKFLHFTSAPITASYANFKAMFHIVKQDQINTNEEFQKYIKDPAKWILDLSEKEQQLFFKVLDSSSAITYPYENKE